MTKKRISAKTLFALSLLFLFNANINLIDPLPDFIAYLLIMPAIGAAANTVPYLSECKSALGVLALISAARIPAFIVMYNNLGTGRDIVPMFTLIFVVIECILLYKAVENGYRALCYISERTGARSLTEPFACGKKGKTMSVTALKGLTYIFLAARQLLNIAPELLLLTTEDNDIRRQLREAYPAALIVCIFVASVIGVVWVVYARRYVREIAKANEIGSAVSSLEIKGTPEEQMRKSRMKSLTFSLTVLATASVFSFDLTFSDFGNINILPHFIYGIIVFYAIFNLISDKRERISLTVCTGVFTLTSIITHLSLSRFLQEYDYLLLLYSSVARRLYLPVKIFALIEALSLLALLTVSAICFKEFICENTGTSPSSDAYGITSAKMHAGLVKRGCVLFSLSALIGILKCVNVFLKGNVQIAFSEVSDEGFATGTLPWMGTLIFALCVIYVLYSFYFIHDVKNEVRFKYGIEK